MTKKYLIGSLFAAVLLMGAATPFAHAQTAASVCGTSGVRGTLSTQSTLLYQIAGGVTSVCGDGTLVALGSSITPGNDWWRIATKKNTWKNPLVTACIVPLKTTHKVYEGWYNILGVHTPYNNDELNYVSSYRHDGKLITKKEVTDYTNLSSYSTITSSIPYNKPVGMVVSRTTDDKGQSIVKTWINVGSCAVDTSKAPTQIGRDSSNPKVVDGRVAIRTDFLYHRLMSLSACEANTSGTGCTSTKQQLVPVLK